ncbi:nucleotide sugar dehydrogenase [Bacteriovorax sp. BAL6_X]|uniref:nucleotide sugar dehydrogenase n=1 Tax=Bacteriovorax sp. BAL6_X TaxID=1201290 RepID=UPI0003868F88|nr:nucleotide sugar dehydrogenase [Bacteriovorax sp. BAL6_X]EPZ52216.1 nucleotide sugar dehydrogenase [Bacteriovorax sp. BAL6_X]
MKDTTLAIIGVGYVGINLAVRFPQFFKTFAFDIDKEKINALNRGVDISNQFPADVLSSSGCIFTSNVDALQEANYYLITVPTPLDSNNAPDQSLVDQAVIGLKDYLCSGDTVVIESTVMPGTTNYFKNILGRDDIFFAFSPERISPNDGYIQFEDIVKVVSCESQEKLNDLVLIYSKIFRLVESSQDLEACEFAKLLENTSRDINIAMMNEFYQGALEKGINFQESLRLARSKWNFPEVDKGLVGGHCISVDPYYLSAYLGLSEDSIILKSRKVNDSMVISLEERILAMSKIGDRVLLLGKTYKKNCNDTRDSRALELYEKLKLRIDRVIDSFDPYIDKSIQILDYKNFDLIVTLVAHDEFMLEKGMWSKLLNPNGAIFDFAQVIPKELEGQFKIYY